MNENQPRGIKGLLSQGVQSAPPKEEPPQSSTLDPHLEAAINKAKNRPRITFTGMEEVAVLYYLVEIVPKFKPAPKVTSVVRQALKEEYPDEWEAVTQAIESMK